MYNQYFVRTQTAIHSRHLFYPNNNNNILLHFIPFMDYGNIRHNVLYRTRYAFFFSGWHIIMLRSKLET